LVPVLVVGTATLGLALLPMGASALLHLAAGLAVVLGTAAAAMSVRIIRRFSYRRRPHLHRG
jgi:hypothetical protein